MLAFNFSVLILSIPILIIVFLGQTGRLGHLDAVWAALSAGLLYVGVAITGSPKSMMDGLARLGLAQATSRKVIVGIGLASLGTAAGAVSFGMVVTGPMLLAAIALIGWASTTHLAGSK
jgi:hypothetical protein